MTSSTTINRVHRGFYLDSVALMRLSADLGRMEGILDAAVMMGTPANHAILEAAELLTDAGRVATGGDLIMAIRARSAAAADAARAWAEDCLRAPSRSTQPMHANRPRTLGGAKRQMPDANLALISTPGQYATFEARTALGNGMHVMIFSDNVSLDDEVALKREGSARNLFVMGPDCGTAILGGVPLAFANRVAAGPIGLIGASGTGIQEISCLIDRMGGGISHAIGVGGRDLTAEVGGTTTRMAIDALAADARTERLVVVGKPPDPAVASRIIAQLATLTLPSVICFLGAPDLSLPHPVQRARTLKDAALLALGITEPPPPLPDPLIPAKPTGRIVGLYAGGTLCAEAQVMARDAGLAVRSNVPVNGVEAGSAGGDCLCLDLGDDAFTLGQPHPMIEPRVRDGPLREALDGAEVAIILVDLILGQGAHPDPAGALIDCLATVPPAARPRVFCSVTGTAADPQDRAGQIRRLEAAGLIVAPSNADATRWALENRSGS